ncbi:MAG: cytochrome P450 [Candidatus Melainabacteria bacterium]|nr:cytochrome P450 [Candidatus Melainabacteria bacterium]
MTNITADYVNPLVMTDQGFLNDPYPELARLRTGAPIWWCDENKYWIVSSYADVQAVLKDNNFEKQIQTWKHAPSTILANFIPSIKFLRQTTSRWMLNLNKPDHTRVRGLVSKAFSSTTVEQLRPQIEGLAAQFAEQLESAQQPFDLIEKFSLPFPLAVIGLILGIPLSDAEKLKAWSNQVVGLIGGQRDPKRLMAAGKAMREFSQYLEPHIEERRLSPKEDLLSVLVQARENNSSLSLEELISSSILLLIAGFETTANLIANTIVCLDKFPEQAALLKQDFSRTEAAVREVLRFEGPVQSAPRLAGKDMTLGGHDIKQGDLLWVLLGSANRDAEQFDEPDKFDILRDAGRNLAFGDGIHRCIGAGLAELEAVIAIKMLYERFPDLRIAGTVDFRAPFGLRGPKTLPVRVG